METPLLIGIGDLHGHYPALQALMQGLQDKYKVFKEESPLELTSGVEIVFTGDYIDRGTQSLLVISTLMELQKKNPSQVHELFGNHELLALAGQQRARELLQETSDNMLYMGYTLGTLHGHNGGNAFIAEFGKNAKEAFEQFTKRLSHQGDIGSWMRALKPLYLHEFQDYKILFVHGGIPESLGNGDDLEKYVSSFERHMATRTVDFRRDSLKFFHDDKVGGHSLFWDRRIPKMNKRELDEVTKSLGVDYIVIGHTPQQGITNYCNRAFNIDVGMCPAYGENEPAAIVFKSEGIFAFYANREEEKLVDLER